MTEPPDEAGAQNLPAKRAYRPANSPRDKFGPVVPAPVQPHADPPPAAPPAAPAMPPQQPPPTEEAGAEPERLPVPAGTRLPATQRRRRFSPRNTTRNTVIAMLIAMAVICGGGITAVGWYFFGDKITAKPRTPIETVVGFMQAAFGSRDAKALEEHTCADGSQVRQVVTDILDSEKRFNDKVIVTYEGLAKVNDDGERATVTARVTKSSEVNGNTHEGPESLWTFTLANEGDWKVCAIDVGA